mgnify:CR=1 FL=1
MVQGMDQKALEKIVADVPIGRLIEPAEVASLVAFLVSDEASWITGQAISISGGFTRG